MEWLLYGTEPMLRGEKIPMAAEAPVAYDSAQERAAMEKGRSAMGELGDVISKAIKEWAAKK